MKTHVRRMIPIGTILLVALAACGGGGTAATPGGGASSEPGAPTAAGQSAAPSDAATGPSAAATEPGAAATEPAGGPAGDVCELVTADELAGILDLPNITGNVLTGPPDTCDVQSDGAPVAAFVYTLNAGPYVYDAYASDPGATAISGLGDKAAFNPSAQLLVVQKGTTLLSIAIYDDGTRSEADRVDMMKAIAAIAVGRM